MQTLVQDRETKDQGRLGAAFLVALSLHAGALGALALWPSRDVQAPPGEQEITIDLAPAMETAEALAPAEAAAPADVLAEAAEVQPPEPVTAEALPPEEVLPPEEMTEVLPQETAEAVPMEMNEAVQPEVVAEAETAEAVPADAAPVEAEAAPEPEVVAALPPPDETVVAKTLEQKPAPKPKKPPAPKKVEPKPRPAPRKAVAEQRSAPSTPRQGQASSSRENTGGAAASADPNVLNRYAAQLSSTLRRRLRYPEGPKAQGIEGVATVRFTMLRNGRIVGAALVRSAGHPALDQAALAATAPGTSLPPAPDALPQQQFTFAVPLRFDLR
ncbi:TonB family protein [Microvirga sp. GCM10011540]|uniref:energy transducer TonB family protein n=1 Tax=Microvirga sp. GCM10011540 TaxID=3317338 RepID=UPI003620C89F